MTTETLAALMISCAVMSGYTFSKKDYGAMCVFLIFAFMSAFGWFMRIIG